MLEKFTSMKFELSQLKRLVYGSKRERFVSEGEGAQMSLPFDIDTPSQDENSQPVTEKVSSFERKSARTILVG